MALIDIKSVLSDKQAIRDDAYSNIFERQGGDFTVQGLPLFIGVVKDFVGSGKLIIDMQFSNAEDFASIISSTPIEKDLLRANLTAGYTIYKGYVPVVGKPWKFARLKYTVTGSNFTKGTIDAFFAEVGTQQSI